MPKWSARPLSPGKYGTQKGQPLKKNFLVGAPIQHAHAAWRTCMAPACVVLVPENERSRIRISGCYNTGLGSREWRGCTCGLTYIGRAHIYRAGSYIYSMRIRIRPIYTHTDHEPAPWSPRAARRFGKPLACCPLLLMDVAGRLPLCMRAGHCRALRSDPYICFYEYFFKRWW